MEIMMMARQVEVEPDALSKTPGFFLLHIRVFFVKTARRGLRLTKERKKNCPTSDRTLKSSVGKNMYMYLSVSIVL